MADSNNVRQQEIDAANEFLTLLGIPATQPGTNNVLTLTGRLVLLRDYINTIENLNLAYETSIESLKAIGRANTSPQGAQTGRQAIFNALDLIVTRLKPQAPSTTTASTGRGGSRTVS